MKRLSLIVACLLVTNVSAHAIEDSGLGGLNAGVINKQNMMQLQDEKIEKNYIDSVPAKPQAEKPVIEDETSKKNIQKGNLTYNPEFTLNKVVFQGNTVYSDKKLQTLVASYIGKNVYLEDVMNLTIDISRFYQKNGYLTSYAYLTPQEIVDGVVVINIKESRVAEKDSSGNRWEKDWYLNNIALGGFGLNKNRVFNSKSLQGAMKNINKEAYYKGSAEITKNEQDDTVIKLHVADRFPLNFDFSWDDFGRNYTGRQRATGIIGLDNLTGYGDKIYAGAILSQGANGALAGYQIPVGPYGTKLSFDYSYSRINVGGPYRDNNIYGNSTDYVIRLTQPIKNTATQEINFSIALDALNSTTYNAAGQNTRMDYNLRVMRTGLYGMFDDKKGRTIGSVGVDLGMTGMGSSPNQDSGPQSTFYKVLASIARIQRLPKSCLAILRLNMQYSPQALYPSEQMYLGGIYSVRGFQPSELMGDYGVAGSLELRTPVPGFQKVLPKKVKHWSDKVKLAFFYDWGYIKENAKAAPYDYPCNFLQSVGVGTYVNLTEAISVQMGVGIPVGIKPVGADNARMYFSVNTDIDRIFMKPKERL